MSTEDIFMTVPNQKDLQTLQTAIEDGKLVKIRYNEYRMTFCQQTENIYSVEIIDGKAKTEEQKKQDKIDELNKQLHQLQGN